jgi:DUF1680 family protein
MTAPATTSSARLRTLPLAAARWTSGLMHERYRQCIEVTIPSMGELMQREERIRFVGNFEVAAGLAEGRHRGPKWNDGDFYKWLEAAAASLAFARDEELDRHLDVLIELIAKAQDADGYIHTDVQIAQRAGQNAPRFGNPMDFEMYNMGHLITAAVIHKRATGKTTLLSRAIAAADFLVKTFDHPTPTMARHGICPSHLMALVELYRETGAKKYLDLAAKLLDMRDLVEHGDDDNQDRVKLRDECRAVGHAVRATYLYTGAADIYLETGDESLMKAMQPIWHDLVARKLYITGGCGALYDGASPDGAIDQATIRRVHQAFGRPFQLPHETAHNETCAAIGSMLWNWRMFLMTGEAKFADLVEWTLYNSVLAGVNLHGDAFFYTNPLRRLDPPWLELRWPRRREKRLSCFCCPPNVARTIAQSSTYAYAESDRGLHIVLYGAGTLETSRIKLTQETNYPWDGRVRFTIQSAPKGDFSLYLRMPGWAKCASVRINDKASGASPQPGTFHEIRRQWSAGDIVELQLPMPARMIEADPRVEETRNQVAVVRGPVVYCLESADLPAGTRVLDVQLPRDAVLSARFDGELLGGVTVLEGQARVVSRSASSKQLYRDHAPAAARAIDLRLIPYFAWDNRGEGEMTVWLA